MVELLNECFMDCTYFKEDYKRMAMRIKMRISEAKLHKLNINTIGELASVDVNFIISELHSYNT